LADYQFLVVFTFVAICLARDMAIAFRRRMEAANEQRTARWTM